MRQYKLIAGKAVREAALAGDAFAREIVTQAGCWLGLGLVNLLHLFNPQAIVIGGSVSQLGDLLFDLAREVIREHIMHDRFYNKDEDEDILRLAAFGDDVCMYGAVYYAWQNQSKDSEEPKS